MGYSSRLSHLVLGMQEILIMIECKTEAEMIHFIKEWIVKNYPKSRIPNPDYIQAGTYSAQWKALGAIYYWKFKDTIVALRYGRESSDATSICFALKG